MLNNYNQKNATGRAVVGPSRSNKKPATGRRRRRQATGRGRRRARKGGGSKNIDQKIMERTSDMYSINTSPWSVSGTLPQSYFRGGLTAPKHKRWGVGERFTGCSLVGNMSLVEGNFRTLVPSTPRFDTVLSQYTDLLYYYQNALGFGSPGDQLAFAVHPGLIPRLNTECQNWGRYIIRNIVAHYIPKSSTFYNDGYMSAFTKDVVGAFDVNIATFNNWAFQSGDIRGGALWQGFKHAIDDMTTDETWSTTVPTIDPDTVSTSVMQNSNVLADIAGDFYQLIHVLYTGGDGSGQTGNFGWVFYEYIVDFYQQRLDPNIFIEDLVLPNPTDPTLTGARTKSRALPRTHKNINYRLPSPPMELTLQGDQKAPLAPKELKEIIPDPPKLVRQTGYVEAVRASLEPKIPDMKSAPGSGPMENLKFIGRRRTVAPKEVRSSSLGKKLGSLHLGDTTSLSSECDEGL